MKLDPRSGFATFGLVIVLVQSCKLLDLANPTNVMLLRAIYVISQVLIFTIFFKIKAKIGALPEGGKVADTDQTIKNHDLEEWKQKRKQLFIGLAVALLLQIYLEKAESLVVQSILPWKLMYYSPLFQVHMLNLEAEGPNARPWTPPKKKAAVPPTAENQDLADDG